MVTKNLGMVTAYAYAKEGGYTGTEAEFEQLMADLAVEVDEFENFSVTVTTLPAGSSATASYSNGVLSLGIPKGDKGDTGDTGATGAAAGFGTVTASVDSNVGTPSVDVTTSGADTAKNFGFAFHNLKGEKGDKGDTGEVSEAELAETLESYAKTDGSYENFTAGNAKQLVSNVRVNDKTPYLFRTSGGSVDIGDREYVNGIVGGTVAWNQLVNGATKTDRGVTATFDSTTKKYTLSGTSASSYAETFGVLSLISDHKYLTRGIVLKNPNNIPIRAGLLSGGTAASNNGLENITKANNTQSAHTGIAGFSANTDFTGVEMMLTAFDLTQMFGSTIADYIYSLEQANAGAGVAWFKKLFPKPYYAYNAGTLKHVEGLVSHAMNGFNQWDEEWESGAINGADGSAYADASKIRSKNFIPVVGGITYYVKAPSVFNYAWYDADKSYISGDNSATANYTRTAPVNARYLKFSIGGTTYKNDICINISWDGSRDGEYEPYVKNSYPLDDSLTLRGIPKLDANNNLYYDGDTYESDGTVTRRYAQLVLNGSESWSKSSSALNGFYHNMSGSMKPYAPIVNSYGLQFTSDTNTYFNNYGYCYTDYSTNMNIDPAIVGNTVDSFKAWLASHPITVVYERDTPITESADPYQQVQIVNDFGTEEYVLDNSAFPVPVGHDTDYPVNLVAKLEMAPNSPEGNGDYIVRQVNGENSYVPLVIEDSLPTIPSTAGSYKLTVTVAEGSDPVLSWEAE